MLSIYESQGVQQQGREVEKPTQKRIKQNEYREGKRSPKNEEQKQRDREQARIRRSLIKKGLHVPSYQKEPHWFKCSCCLAKIGLGSGKSAKIIGCNRGAITRHWMTNNIKSNLPKKNGWGSPVSFERKQQKKQQDLTKKYHQAWMSEINVKFPDWGQLWLKEKSRISMNKKYRNMSVAEKKDYNKKVYQSKRIRYENNPHIAQRHKNKVNEWKKLNPEKVRQSITKSIKKRKAIDQGFRVTCNLRNRFRDLIKTSRKGGSHQISKLIGCSTKELAKHLESQFKPGMSWDNYGFYGWHVDHIIPCSKFDHSDPKQVQQCWHWSNLQPLWAEENLKKSDKITESQLESLLCSH